MHANVIRVLLNVYLPNSLLPPMKLQEVLKEIIKVILILTQTMILLLKFKV